MHRRRAVFLDRDGVLNRLVYRSDLGFLDSPVHPRELVLVPEAAESVARLNRAGFRVLVATNQPGLAKGTLDAAALKAIHDALREQLAAGGGRLDGVYVCPHHPGGIVPALAITCDCRKPAPGLLRRAADDLQLDLESSYMVGDGDGDVLAGAAAGTGTVLIANLKPCVAELLDARGAWPNHIAASLREAVEVILAAQRGQRLPGGFPGHQEVSPAAHVAAYLSGARTALGAIDQMAVRAVLGELLELQRRGGQLHLVDARECDHAGAAVGDGRADGGPSFAGRLAAGALSADDLMLIVCAGMRRLKRDAAQAICETVRQARRQGARVCAILDEPVPPGWGPVSAAVITTANPGHAGEVQTVLLGLLTSSSGTREEMQAAGTSAWPASR